MNEFLIELLWVIEIAGRGHVQRPISISSTSTIATATHRNPTQTSPNQTLAFNGAILNESQNSLPK